MDPISEKADILLRYAGVAAAFLTFVFARSVRETKQDPDSLLFFWSVRMAFGLAAWLMWISGLGILATYLLRMMLLYPLRSSVRGIIFWGIPSSLLLSYLLVVCSSVILTSLASVYQLYSTQWRWTVRQILATCDLLLAPVRPSEDLGETLEEE